MDSNTKVEQVKPEIAVELNNDEFLKSLSQIIDINPKFKARVWRDGIELEMFEDDKRIFGSTVTIYTTKDWETEKRRFEISAGSMGSFDLSCQASVGRYLTMAELIKKFDKVKQLCFKHCEEYSRIF